MIASLNGIILAKTPASVIIEVGGVGFAVEMSLRSIERLGETGSQVRILTELVVREDALVLYGFTSEEERSLFDSLRSVSGVGPKVALSLLSTHGPEALASAIAAQDVAMVQKAPGIGKKTAQRIILELKDHLDMFATDAQPVRSSGQSDAVKVTYEALLSMGFTSAEVELAVKDLPGDATEAYALQYALKRLGQ